MWVGLCCIVVRVGLLLAACKAHEVRRGDQSSVVVYRDSDGPSPLSPLSLSRCTVGCGWIRMSRDEVRARWLASTCHKRHVSRGVKRHVSRAAACAQFSADKLDTILLKDILLQDILLKVGYGRIFLLNNTLYS